MYGRDRGERGGRFGGERRSYGGGGYGGGQRERFGGSDRGGEPKPVKVGDELDVTIEAIAAKGDGIAKKDGFVIFVPGAANGEKVRVRITDVRRTCAVGEKIGEGSGAAPSPASDEEEPSEDELNDTDEEGEEEEEAVAEPGV